MLANGGPAVGVDGAGGPEYEHPFTALHQFATFSGGMVSAALEQYSPLNLPSLTSPWHLS